ncbi:ABC transporter ATP-binding protein [Sinomicrobium weinanense]|uniref:ABC transporter ATP-binding protein n=1 Tax=Sinomicrobium weinanense TaxID=2842200 RepID=A0A926Q4S8_9FLAO|nr:ABC transporter ATP-binding protein [Sinomicrobium weinanense]MBC9798309.1 ABC transporter ATP-binding protein [Sinomicrobium weinanense]MBU3121774.1 ABC transporter ATP-binding protein [Sinomicrobium weinanense]
MVSIQNLNKAFGRNQVLDNLSLQINQKGVTAILGPNGSGKTTLIKSILGMTIPDKGTITINGRDIKKDVLYRENLDYLPQIADFPDNLKVKELIKMIKDLRNKPARDETLIRFFGLEPFLDKKLNTLSGGTRQKVNLILAFMFDSPLMILDEPSSGLDPVSLIRLKEWINMEKAQGKIILVTSHIMSFVEEIAENIAFLLDGKIYFNGSLSQLRTKTGQEDLEHAIASLLLPSTPLRDRGKPPLRSCPAPNLKL